MSNARRLFLVDPSKIVEHPPTLPTDPAEIPEGLIPGWEAYAPCFDRGPDSVIGPFDPVVSRKYGRFCISTGDADFWYDTKDTDHTARPHRPCWYQSGYTLRFVAKREDKR